MQLRLKQSLAGFAVLLALSSCSMFLPPQTRMSFGLLPTNELGYEVDETGKITVTTRTMVFSNPAGMPATNITGYRIAYYSAAGTLVGQTSSTPQSLSIFVPAGFRCSTPDPLEGCNLQSDGARPAPGPDATSTALADQLLSADIALQHVAAGMPAGWYADITFFGYSSAGEFQETYRLYIVVPN